MTVLFNGNKQHVSCDTYARYRNTFTRYATRDKHG